MQKLSELEEEDDNQWDDDFIFDAPVGQKQLATKIEGPDVLPSDEDEEMEEFDQQRKQSNASLLGDKVNLSSFLLHDLRSKGMHLDADDSLPNIGLEGLDMDDDNSGDAPLRYPVVGAPEVDPFRLRQLEARKASTHQHSAGFPDLSTSTEQMAYQPMLEEDDDWDNEILQESNPAAGQKQPNYLELSQKLIANMRQQLYADSTAFLTEKESLLEFLEGSLRKQIRTQKREELRDVGKKAYLAEEEYVPSMRALASWLSRASGYIISTLTSARPDQLALSMLEMELNALGLDFKMITEIVDRCRAESPKESSLFALQLVNKWLRGVILLEYCHLNDADNKSGQGRWPKEVICTIIDNVHGVVDHLLALKESPLNKTNRLMAEQLDIIQQTISTVDFQPHHALLREVKAMDKYIQQILQYLEVCRLRLSYIALADTLRLIYHHGDGNQDIHAVNQHKSLLAANEDLFQRMDRLRSDHINILMYYLPVVDKLSQGNIGMNAADLDAMLKLKVLQIMQNTIMRGQKQSILYHPYRLKDGQKLVQIIVSLQGECLVNKFLLLADCCLLTYAAHRPFPASSSVLRSETKELKMQERSFCSVTTDRRKGDTSNIGENKGKERTYLFEYELQLGEQYVEMMLQLNSTPMVRAKLEYATVVYLRKVLTGKMVWQNHTYFDRIICRTVRGESSYGIDEAENMLVMSFMEALGPLEDVGSLAITLADAIIELFPLTADSGSANINMLNNFSNSAGQGPALYSQNNTGKPNEKAKNLSQFFQHAMSTCLNLHQSIEDLFRGTFAAPLAYITRYELWLLAYEVMRVLTPLLHDMTPHTCLEFQQLLYHISVYLQLPKQHEFANKKHVFLAAMHTGRVALACEYGNLVYKHIQEMQFVKRNGCKEKFGSDNHSSSVMQRFPYYELHSYEHINICRRYADQCLLNGNPLEAISVYVNTVHLMQTAPVYKNHVEHWLNLDSLIFGLSAAYLHLRVPEKAALVLQEHIQNLYHRPPSLSNDMNKVYALQILAEALFDLTNYKSCWKVIRLIKSIRQERCLAVMDGLQRAGEQLVIQYQANNLKSLSSNQSSSSQHSGEQHRGVNGRADHEHKPVGEQPISFLSKSVEVISKRRELRQAMAHYCPDYPQGLLSFLHIPALSPLYFPKMRSSICYQSVDVNHILTRIYFQSRMYAAALSSLLPLIIVQELWLGGIYSLRKTSDDSAGHNPDHHSFKPFDAQKEYQEKHFLAELYYLRASIQLEACQRSRSSSDLRYPITLNSPALPQLIQNLSTLILVVRQWLRHEHEMYVGDGTGLYFDVKEMKRAIVKHCISWKRNIVYVSPSELLMDALKWFHKSWDIFQAIGDVISAAKAANQVANCHLFPLFVPMAFLKVPYEAARDLSNYELVHWSQGNEGGGNSLSYSFPPRQAAPLPRGMTYVDLASRAQGVKLMSLEEAELASFFAYDVFVDVSLPLELMESFLIRAEISYLQGHVEDALSSWWESKELLMQLFVDGILVPTLRHNSYGFHLEMKKLLHRLLLMFLRFDEAVRRKHLFLFDVHHVFSLEKNRLVRSLSAKASALHRSMNSLFSFCAKESKDRQFTLAATGNNHSNYNIPVGHDSLSSEVGHHPASQQNLPHGPLRRTYTFSPPNSPHLATPPHRPLESHISPDSVRTAPVVGVMGLCRGWLGSFAARRSRRSPPPTTLYNERTQSLNYSTINSLEIIVTPTGSPNHLMPNELQANGSTQPESIVHYAVVEEILDELKFVDASSILCQVILKEVREKVFDFGWSRYLPALATTSHAMMVKAFREVSEAHVHGDDEDERMAEEDEENAYLQNLQLPALVLQHTLRVQDLFEANVEEDSSQRGNFGGNDGRVKSKTKRSPNCPSSPSLKWFTNSPESLQAWRLKGRPIDPYKDFSFMKTPSGTNIPVSPSTTSSYMPSKDSLAPGEGHVLQDSNGEKQMIVNVMLGFQRIEMLLWRYSYHRNLSLPVLSKCARFSVLDIATSMLRLRAFSKQYKPTVYAQEAVVSFMNDASEDFCNSHVIGRWQKIVHLTYINQLLVAYHPLSGRLFIQPVGLGFYPYVWHQQHVKKHDREAPHPQFNLSFPSPSPSSSIKVSIDPLEGGSQSSASSETTARMSYISARRADGTDDANSLLAASSLFPNFSPSHLLFSRESLELILDYNVAEQDDGYGGGKAVRVNTLHQLQKGIFLNLTTFFQLIMETVDNAKEWHVPSSGSKGALLSSALDQLFSAFQRRKMTSDQRSQSHSLNPSFWGVKPSDLLSHSQSDYGLVNHHHNQPSSNTQQLKLRMDLLQPLTIICGNAVAGLPWESILREVSPIVRGTTHLSFICQLLEPAMSLTTDHHTAFPMRPMTSSEPTGGRSALPALARRLAEWWAPTMHNHSQSATHHATRSQGDGPFSASSADSRGVDIHENHHSIRGTMGASLHQRVVLVCVDWDHQALPIRLMKELKARLQQRKLLIGVQQLTAFGQNYDNITGQERYRRILSSPTHKSHKSERMPKSLVEKFMYRLRRFAQKEQLLRVNCSSVTDPVAHFVVLHFLGSHLQSIVRSAVLPLPSFISEQQWENRLNELPAIHLPLYSELLPRPAHDVLPSVAEFWNQIPKALQPSTHRATRSSASSPTPAVVSTASSSGKLREIAVIAMFTIGDMVEMTEAVMYLTHVWKRDCIVIFAPAFLQEKLWKELRRLLHSFQQVVLELLQKVQQQHMGKRKEEVTHSDSESHSAYVASTPVEHGAHGQEAQDHADQHDPPPPPPIGERERSPGSIATAIAKDSVADMVVMDEEAMAVLLQRSNSALSMLADPSATADGPSISSLHSLLPIVASSAEDEEATVKRFPAAPARLSTPVLSAPKASVFFSEVSARQRKPILSTILPPPIAMADVQRDSGRSEMDKDDKEESHGQLSDKAAMISRQTRPMPALPPPLKMPTLTMNFRLFPPVSRNGSPRSASSSSSPAVEPTSSRPVASDNHSVTSQDSKGMDSRSRVAKIDLSPALKALLQSTQPNLILYQLILQVVQQMQEEHDVAITVMF